MKKLKRTGTFLRFFLHGKRVALLWAVFASVSVNLPAQNLVYVGGTLTGTRFWSRDSIYIVYQDLKIADSAMLTVEPGTWVKVVQGRGILVNGILRSGSPDAPHDTTVFMSNSQKGTAAWRWKGITFQNCSHSDSSYILYTLIKDAEIAVELNNCNGIEISGCRIIQNQNSGIRLFNSSRCTITRCDVTGNYTGIEINADLLHKSSLNLIENNFLQNENYNIYMYRQMGGVMNNNLISFNLMQNANNGLWIDNEGDAGVEKNVVEKNVFVGNGGNAGYALFVSNDSTNVLNNIFWKNNIAVFCEQNITDVNIIGNSFYENNSGIVLGRQSFGYFITENTFALHKNNMVTFRELTLNQFTKNNIFCADTLEKQVINETNEEGFIDNNFWNTENDSLIQRFVWDKNDNPFLGELHYLPVLHTPDTLAPPAPPLSVKKQLVDNKIRLTWTNGKEADLKGYKLYLGNFYRYRFDSVRFIGSDTTFVMDNQNINQMMAITAADNEDTVAFPQLSAHESPYAFAKLYPYAGDEKIICKFHDSVSLDKASVPYPYEKIRWTSDGDGIFNNNTLTRPVYYPGTGDIKNGEVRLSLNVLGSDGNWLSDSFVLHIFDNPVSVAGNDTTIAENDTLFLTAASAENYQSVHWFTSGDGVFGNDSLLNTFYIPGEKDKTNRHVTLSLFSYSLCGFASDTAEINLLPEFSLEGSVVLNGKAFGAPCTLLAVNADDADFRTINITRPGTDGRFLYRNILQGNYYLYAVPDTVSQTAFPSYYAENLNWQEAYLLPLTAVTKDVDIQLVPRESMLPKGEGSISGHFDFPGNSTAFSPYFYKWFEARGEKIAAKNGMPNVTILLLSPQKKEPLKYTLTDQNGDFYFNELPYGTYALEVELTGYPSEKQLITITPDNKNIAGITISLQQKSIKISNVPHVTPKEDLIVYPNPVKDVLTLCWIKPVTPETCRYVLLDMHGKRVLSGDLIFGINKKTAIIKGLDNFDSGIYILNINGKGVNSSVKIVLN